MRSAVLLIAALPSLAQINRATPAAANVPNTAAAPTVSQMKLARIPLGTFVSLERAFDGKLTGIPAADHKDPVDLLGATRGIYLDGYGVVFTAEMGLILTPTANPFNKISEEQKERVHSAKVSRLQVLKKIVAETVRDIAGQLSQLPPEQQVVVAVRLDYLNWENTAGLPGLVIARADRRSALGGNIQIEEQ